MASNTQTFNGRITLDDKQARQAIEILAKDLERVKRQRKEALNKGNDISGFDHQIKQLSASINALRTNQQAVNDTLKNLSSASYKELSVAMRTLQKQLRSGAVERNSEEWKMLQQKLKEVKREMAAINSECKESVGTWGRLTNWLNANWGAVTQIITGYNTLRETVQKCTQAYADMEESMADVRKYTGQTDEQVHEMNEDFKRMDTRTAREQLNELAGAAGRLGITSKEMIEEFVDGADKINVALGDDLGKGAVDKIGKLAQMFGEDKTKGLRGAMLATGSAVNELAQNSSANAGYIVDFTADLSGVGIQAGMTQAQLMGLASALDQNMQEEATSATVFSQLITKMYQDPAKFAKIAGMQVKEFTNLMKTNANEGLMKFMQSMKSKGGFAEMAPMFEEMKLNGTRAVGVLSAVASHLDQVTEAQDLATKSYAAGTSVLDEFNVQNNTVQAKLDKAKKTFQDITVELGEKLMPVTTLCVSVASGSVKILSSIIEFAYKYRTSLVALTTVIAALTVAENLHVIKLKLIAVWNDVVVAGCKKLWVTLLANPYVAVTGAVAMLVAVIVDLTRKTDTATKAQEELNDIRKQAAKDIVEEKEKLENLRSVAKDEHQSLQDRYTAIAELNKIVPNYNASIDKTTGKYKENKQALDNYIQSLVKLYEVQGAKKKIQQLSEELVDLRIKEKDAQKNYDNAKKAGEGVTYTTSWGSVGNTTQDTTGHYKGILDSIRKDKAEREALINSIKDAYGDDIRKQEVKEVQQTIEQNTPSSTGSSTHTMTEKERKAAEKARKKAEAEARKAAAKRKAELKKELDDAKKGTQAEELETTTLYSTGQIRLAEYNDRMKQIKQQGLQERMDILKKYGEAESEEYKRLGAEKEKIAADYEKKQTTDLEELEINRQSAEMNIRSNFYNKDSDIYHDEDALNEALFLLDQNYLAQKQELYQSSSDEYWQIAREMERNEQQHQYERQEQYDKTLLQLKQEYLNLGNEEQMKLEMKGLDNVHKAGLVSEEEYQKMKKAIASKYAVASDEQRKQDATTALDKAKKMTKQGDDHGSSLGSDNLAIVAGGAVAAIQQQKMVNENLKILRDQDLISEQQYQDAKKQMNKETYDAILSSASAAYSSISSLMSAASAYSQACSDLEVAKIEKNYEKQINAAGNNSSKKKRLEAKRDKEVAAAKSKANKKAMNIELAQAVASTAMAAINAYSSAASIPYVGYIIAPIAAGLALAAGMLQVATIKKQHQAEAAGYYEGGFTGQGNYKKEVGVVHAGEFVANHNAVNNPQLLPALRLIDMAQRNNTVASLTAQDVSRAMGTGGAAVVAPVVNVSGGDTEQVGASLDNVSNTIDRLNQQLEDGIQSYVVITGPDGLDRRWSQYQKMKSNK